MTSNGRGGVPCDTSTTKGSNDDDIGSVNWRDSEKKSQVAHNKSSRSGGVSPSSFYPTKVKLHISSKSKTRDRLVISKSISSGAANLPISHTLTNILSQASQRVVQNQFKELWDREKLKRTAFKDTLAPSNRSIKLFGLQADAFKDFNIRLTEHLRHHKSNDREQANPKFSADLALQLIRSAAQFDTEIASDSEHEILQEASSISSIDEPKRQRAFYAVTSIETKENTQTQHLTQVSPGCSTQREAFKAEFAREKILPILDVTETNSLSTPQWSMEPRIFSKELSSNGKRKYVVSSYGSFVDYYWRKILPTGRHYYELIRENTPCRLYLDLEFSKETNPVLAASKQLSEQLVTELIHEICLEFHSEFGNLLDQPCSLDRHNFVDLDSSTNSKFSRHIIMHLPNHMLFANNVQVGVFIKNMVARLAEEIGTGTLNARSPVLAKFLFLNKPPGAKDSSTRNGTINKEGKDENLLRNDKNTTEQDSSLCQAGESEENSNKMKHQSQQLLASGFIEKSTCFVDLGVYSKNRLFRLLGSSKYGKTPAASLRISDTNTFPFIDFSYEKFYSSEPARADVEGNAISDLCLNSSNTNEETDTPRLHACVDWSPYAEALEKTLVVPLNWSRLKFPLLPTLELKEGRKTTNIYVCKNKSSASSRYITSSGLSPFPCLDDYIKNVLGRRGGIEGDIRSWSISYLNEKDDADEDIHVKDKPCLSRAATITYQISKNRWCERIGRHHKSNGIMWTVDLRKMYCFQTCYDSDCRLSGFCGKPVELPTDVRLIIDDILFEAALATLDEEEIVAEHERRKREEEEFERALLRLDISGPSCKDKTL